MSSVAPRTPLPTATPLSSEIYRDCVQHAQSVLAINERKALQLRPVLERRRSGSVLSDSSSASPPSSPDDTRSVYVNQRQPNSPFIDPTQPHQIAIMVKNGIFNLYVEHAEDHIHQHQTSGKVSKISRARVELQLLTAINDGDLPIDYKLCWNSAILHSKYFTTFWLDVARRLNLPNECIERYTTNDELLEYETPTSARTNAGSSRSRIVEQKPRFSSGRVRVNATQFRTPSTDDEDNETEEYITPEAAAYARRLGGEGSSTASSTREVSSPDPRGLIGLDIAGLARETGDDGAWGSSRRRSSSKPSTPRASASALRTPRITPPHARNAAGLQAAKRDFAAIADEGESYGSPSKKARKDGAGNKTSVAGRHRTKTAKAKAAMHRQM